MNRPQCLAVIRATITVSFIALVLLATVPGLRCHAVAGGLGIAACATVSIVSGLFYLHHANRRSS